MDTLALGYSLPATGRLRDFHPLEHAPAGRTTKKKLSDLADSFVIFSSLLITSLPTSLNIRISFFIDRGSFDVGHLAIIGYKR